MTQNVPLDPGDVVPEPFFDATQEMLSGLAVNFEVVATSSTVVTVRAGVGAAQVSVAVQGRYRFVTADISRAHPGGAAGTYDLFCTALATNPITGAPAGNDYSFALAIVPGGGTPAGVGIYRLMRHITWNGAAITGIGRLELEGPGGPAGGDLAGWFPRPTIGPFPADRVLSWGGDTSIFRSGASQLRTDGSFVASGLVVSKAGVDGALAVSKPGDAHWRAVLFNDGLYGLQFGDGTNDLDTRIYRSGAGVIRSDGVLAADLQATGGNVLGGLASGPAAALPAQPAAYIPIRDAAGTRVYVPAYVP